MGRSILADEKIQTFLEDLYGKETWVIGFIIGQLTRQKDYAVHMIKTPQVEEEVAGGEGGGGKKAKKPPPPLNHIDELWVATHSKQVLRMLPGGLDIIGIFAMASEEMMKVAQSKLRQVLYAVHKVVHRSQAAMKQEEEITDRFLVQICATSRKLTCKTFDVSDVNSVAKPADWRVQSFLERWIRLDTSLTVDLDMPIAVSSMSQTLNKQIQGGIAPVCRSVWGAVATVNSCLHPESDLVDTSQQQQSGKKGKKQSNTSPASAHKYEVQLLTQLASNNNTTEECTVTECGARMTMRGTLCGRAFVHGKATIKEATQAVKCDVIRSLLSRCELLCEDLLQTEEEQDPKVLYETPIRVFGQLQDTPLYLCDYMFPDEKPKDSVERFQELVNLAVTEDDLDLDCERIPTDEELERPMKAASQKVSVGKQTGYINVLGMVAGGVLAVLTAGISYLYLGQE